MGLMRFRIVKKTAKYLIVSDEIKLGKGANLKIKDYRGSTPHVFRSNGDQKRKGEVRKK